MFYEDVSTIRKLVAESLLQCMAGEFSVEQKSNEERCFYVKKLEDHEVERKKLIE